VQKPSPSTDQPSVGAWRGEYCESASGLEFHSSDTRLHSFHLLIPNFQSLNYETHCLSTGRVTGSIGNYICRWRPRATITHSSGRNTDGGGRGAGLAGAFETKTHRDHFDTKDRPIGRREHRTNEVPILRRHFEQGFDQRQGGRNFHQLTLLRFGLSVGGSAEMVNAHRAIGRTVLKSVLLAWLKRPLAILCRDVQGLWALVRAQSAMRPRLSNYYLNPPGGSRRIHLRIASDGCGVLIVDATDAVHLNPSAAIMVKLALDGWSRDQVVSALNSRFDRMKNSEVYKHVDRMYSLVHHLSTTTDACHTCGFEALRSPLFSTPVTAPYKADLALTYGCNNACRHCYNRVEPKSPFHVGEGKGETMPVSQWKKVLQKLADIGVPHVIFTGGEPTLYTDLCDLIREAEHLGLITGLNTNGRRLAVRVFTDSLVSAGLSHVQITLESCRVDVHNGMTAADSFEETCRGITNAIAAGLHVITNTTLTRQNVDHALETVDFLDRLGINTFAMNWMIFSGRGFRNNDALAVEELASVLAAVRDRAKALGMRFLWYTPTDYCRLSPLELELGPRRCNAGEYSMCIEPNGDVLPCQSYYVVAGNILRDPWQRIWQSDLFRGFRNRVRDPQACGLPEECWRCPDLPMCGGGCRLERVSKDERL
jgi:radical SAM protein with 4Fe4S-binding SPASM domain